MRIFIRCISIAIWDRTESSKPPRRCIIRRRNSVKIDRPGHTIVFFTIYTFILFRSLAGCSIRPIGANRFAVVFGARGRIGGGAPAVVFGSVGAPDRGRSVPRLECGARSVDKIRSERPRANDHRIATAPPFSGLRRVESNPLFSPAARVFDRIGNRLRNAYGAIAGRFGCVRPGKAELTSNRPRSTQPDAEPATGFITDTFVRQCHPSGSVRRRFGVSASKSDVDFEDFVAVVFES